MAYLFCIVKLSTGKEEFKKEKKMNQIEKIEKEFINSIKLNPYNADLYNDYAIFLCKYKNDYTKACGLLKKAHSLNPYNKIYKYNYSKILRKSDDKFDIYHNLLIFAIVGIMTWLSINEYHNFLNMFSLFIVAQIVMNYQKNICKKYN